MKKSIKLFFDLSMNEQFKILNFESRFIRTLEYKDGSFQKLHYWRGEFIATSFVYSLEERIPKLTNIFLPSTDELHEFIKDLDISGL
ncbi:hypothetical protein [Chondrinema litorale]|uniref:hypothetical protein n=1 Tax=Chondrinema litorale TaxID=2994555 RepID=UPI0025439711|nr:hypothetical protein [Chondrinema litorale]UZS00246.1 hypothetical protein OQ292_40610 [Chondrinema litorale]